MAQLTIRVDIDVSRGALRVAIAGLLMSGLAAQLASESLNLSTYYPPASATYTQLMTTGNTILARDNGAGAGSVVVKSKTNPDGSKLFVNGSIGTSGGLTTAGTSNATGTVLLTYSHATLKADQGGSIELGADNGFANPVGGGTPNISFHNGNVLIQNTADSRLDILTSASATPVLTVNGPRAGVNYATPGATFDVNGVIISASGLNCRQTVFTHKMNSGVACTSGACDGDSPCNASEYVATVGGHLARYSAIQDGSMSMTGTSTNGSAVLSGVTAGTVNTIVIGDYVSGPNIPFSPPTYVTAVDVGGSFVTMSAAASGSATTTFTFVGSGAVLCCRCPLGVCPSLP